MDLASQCGRWSTDGTAELRGNGMFVRRDALEAVGGWSPRALTEDLELSTRLVANGGHVTLAPEVAVVEEAVESLGALWRQRLRWAEGSLRRLLEHGPACLPARSRSAGRPTSWPSPASSSSRRSSPPRSSPASLTIPLPRRPTGACRPRCSSATGSASSCSPWPACGRRGSAGCGSSGARMRGALFLSHWLLVVPVALVRIAVRPGPSAFVQTPRFTGAPDR